MWDDKGYGWGKGHAHLTFVYLDVFVLLCIGAVDAGMFRIACLAFLVVPRWVWMIFAGCAGWMWLSLCFASFDTKLASTTEWSSRCKESKE